MKKKLKMKNVNEIEEITETAILNIKEEAKIFCKILLDLYSDKISSDIEKQAHLGQVRCEVVLESKKIPEHLNNKYNGTNTFIDYGITEYFKEYGYTVFNSVIGTNKKTKTDTISFLIKWK